MFPRENVFLKWAPLVACFIVFLIIFQQTFLSLVKTWSESTTFEHSFLIGPIALWLVYRKRFELAKSDIVFSPLIFIVVLCLSFSWLLGTIAGINAIAQFSIMSMPLFLVWALYGKSFVSVIRFPLFFLILSVPFGEFLVPQLQEVTADITVFVLRAVNIPIYREGLFLHIPEGIFHVAEACSGIRFLFSTITLTLLIIHLQISSRKRQAIFLVCGILIPIIANGLRAFMIVFIGHVSDMQAAVGFDHIVYGWVFFSIVIVLVVILGNKMSDVGPEVAVNQTNISIPSPKFVHLTLLVCSISLGPLVNLAYTNKLDSVKSAFAANNEHSRKNIAELSWKPIFPDADKTSFKLSDDSIEYAIRYHFETADKELISWKNRLYDPEHWTIKSTAYGNVTLKEQNIPYVKVKIVNARGTVRDIVMAYKVGDRFFNQQTKAKMFQLVSKLTFRDFGGAVLISSAEANEGITPENLVKRALDFYMNDEN